MRVPTSRLRIIRDPEDFPEREVELPKTPGALLRDLREQQNLSIEELATRTRVPRASLLALEEDRYDELPGPVFVKGFLRCCARTLEVDPEAFFELLYAQSEDEDPPEEPSGRTPSDSVLALADSVEPVGEQQPPASGEPPVATTPSLFAELWMRFDPVVRRVGQMTGKLPSRQLLWLGVVLLLALLVLAAFTLGMSGGGVFAPAS